MSLLHIHLAQIRQEIAQMTFDGHLSDSTVNLHVRNIEHELTAIEQHEDEKEGRATG